MDAGRCGNVVQSAKLLLLLLLLLLLQLSFQSEATVLTVVCIKQKRINIRKGNNKKTQ